MTRTIAAVSVSDGVRLPVVRQGEPDGVAVLMLHGWSDTWRSFEPILPHLPPAVDAIALTQRGHGDADRPQYGYAIEQFAEDAVGALDELDVERAVLVGHSLGAWVVQQVAAEHPERVAGVVLAGAISSPRHSEELKELSQEVAGLTDPVDPEFVREFQLSTTERPLDPALLDMFVEESLKMPARVWRAIDVKFPAFDLDAVQPRIEAPALIVWGERDGFASRADQDRHLATLRDARLVAYPGTGHAVHWEQPRRFAADVTAFAEGAAQR
jgi:non-heme chloroperoxidase